MRLFASGDENIPASRTLNAAFDVGKEDAKAALLLSLAEVWVPEGSAEEAMVVDRMLTTAGWVAGGLMVYVEPAKTVVIPLGASVMAGPMDVTTVMVEPRKVETVLNTEGVGVIAGSDELSPSVEVSSALSPEVVLVGSTPPLVVFAFFLEPEAVGSVSDAVEDSPSEEVSFAPSAEVVEDSPSEDVSFAPSAEAVEDSPSEDVSFAPSAEAVEDSPSEDVSFALSAEGVEVASPSEEVSFAEEVSDADSGEVVDSALLDVSFAASADEVDSAESEVEVGSAPEEAGSEVEVSDPLLDSVPAASVAEGSEVATVIVTPAISVTEPEAASVNVAVGFWMIVVNSPLPVSRRICLKLGT